MQVTQNRQVARRCKRQKILFLCLLFSGIQSNLLSQRDSKSEIFFLAKVRKRMKFLFFGFAFLFWRLVLCFIFVNKWSPLVLYYQRNELDSFFKYQWLQIVSVVSGWMQTKFPFFFAKVTCVWSSNNFPLNWGKKKENFFPFPNLLFVFWSLLL